MNNAMLLVVHLVLNHSRRATPGSWTGDYHDLTKSCVLKPVLLHALQRSKM